MYQLNPTRLTYCPTVIGAVLTAGILLTTPARGQQGTYNPAAPVAPSAAQMDEPLKLIAAAKKVYDDQVKDYSCLFIKKERVNGRLQEDNVISMQVRKKPFSVYMLWFAPRESKGQEVCYVEGKNGGKMRIHATGLRGAVGFVSIDPNDPRVQQNSRHSITEAGIGHLIELYGQRWQQEKQMGRTVVHLADYDYAKRKCVRVEMLHPYDNRYPFYRSVIYFDKMTTLPIRVENYDWPHQGGTPGGDLLESYSYVQMRLNIGLGDDVFNH